MPAYGNSTEAYLEWHYRLISSIFWVPLTLIGICGNLMVILVVMTVRGMKTPTNCYLVSLALADCLFFVSSTPVELSSIHLPEDVFLFGRVGCSILRFLPFLSMNASSLSITAFTVERYIGICHPMKARYICTVKRAQLIIVIIWSCSILYNSTWLFLTDLKPLNYTDWPNAYQCTYSLNRASYKAVFLLDLFAFYWIPLLLYLILYGSMARILVKAGFFDSSTPNSATAPPSFGSEILPMETTVSNRESGRRSVMSSRREGRIQSLRKSQSSVSATTSSGVFRNSVRSGAAASHRPVRGTQSPLIASIASGTDSSKGRRLGPSEFSRVCSSGSMFDNDVTLARPATDSNNSSSNRSHFQLRFRNSREKSPSRDSKAYYGEGLNKARVQVVKMLVVIVVVFALFWLPYRGLVVYNSFTKKPWIEKWYILFAKTMVMVNCAINPILYNVMSGKFRSAFLFMFKRCFGASSSNRARRRSEAPTHAATLNSFGCGPGNHVHYPYPKRLDSSVTPNSIHSGKQASSKLTIPECGRTGRYSPISSGACKQLPRGSLVLPILISQSAGASDDDEIINKDSAKGGEQSARELLCD